MKTTNEQNLKAKHNLRHEAVVFRNVNLAKSFAFRAANIHNVMQNADGNYLVVCFADAGRLLAAGFKVIV